MWGLFANKRLIFNRVSSFIDNKTKNLLEWIKYFHQKHTEHDTKHENHIKRLNIIEEKLTFMPSKAEITNLIDMHYLNHDVRHRLNSLHKRIEQLHFSHQYTPDRVKMMHEKVKELEEKHSLLQTKHERLSTIQEKMPKQQHIITEIAKPKSNFKEKLIQNLAKNSKNYVKNSILNLLQKYNSLPGSKIKEMIVDEQKLCSKSSLYRILSEIEVDETLSVSKEGRERIYSFS